MSTIRSSLKDLLITSQRSHHHGIYLSIVFIVLLNFITNSSVQGQSAGGFSVSGMIVRHPIDPPFRAAIIFSGASPDTAPASATSFTSFNDFASAVGCGDIPGLSRLACLKEVSAEDIRAFTNGPSSGAFSSIVDE